MESEGQVSEGQRQEKASVTPPITPAGGLESCISATFRAPRRGSGWMPVPPLRASAVHWCHRPDA